MKAKEEAKAKYEEENFVEDIDESIPYFPGRRNAESTNGIWRDIKIEGLTLAFGGAHILLDNTSLSLNWG